MLIVMAGLPGSGKSTIASAVARRLGCAVVSVDPIEAAMWRAGVDAREPTGLAAYVVAEVVAEEQLRHGHDVIVDAVNDVAPARRQWHDLADRYGSTPLFVEVRCSDESVHRRRLEQRDRDIAGFPEPSWESVVARRDGFAGWSTARLVLDSTNEVDANAGRVVAAAGAHRAPA